MRYAQAQENLERCGGKGSGTALNQTLIARNLVRVRFVTLAELSHEQTERLVALTFESAQQHFPGWLPTLESARKEAREALAPSHVSRVLLGEDGPLGWIAACHQWGRIWEIHPLIVAPNHQRKGLGQRLVHKIEAVTWSKGALTLLASTSDMTGSTSVSGIDLHRDPIEALNNLRCVRPHPVEFWQKVGYRIVGIIPDAEKLGQPSITLAKGAPR